jgi:hypothetical protein
VMRCLPDWPEMEAMTRAEEGDEESAA